MSVSAPPKIPFEEIESITNEFSDSNFIGESVLGKIYGGQLSLSGELIDVAVRRLDHSFWLQDIAFDKEITILSSIKHKNVVSIVGFCDEKDEMIIINKREALGSLNRHLNGSTLTWMKRLKISIGVAQALSYLHNDVRQNYSVIHHNINSTSILLDEHWEAKLSGFEYCKTIPAGHLDLVYEKLGVGTYKSDVFSFGVVLFEIMCGTKSFTTKEYNDKFQASLAIFHYENGKLYKLVDPDLFKQMDMQSFYIFSETAYYCLDQQDPPSMNQVLKRLEKALEAQLRHENKEHPSTAVREGPSSNHLKSKLKNLEHMRISLKAIELATGTIAPENCLASGGFGTVYKAELEHIDREYCFAIERENERQQLPKRRSEVAIKRIFNTENEFGEQGFYAEIEMLTRCKHSNILALVGFCDEGTAMILIYEYAFNGSLVDYLQNKSNIENDSWVQRLKICLDVANGLSCLHTSEGDRREIVHRDIKSANILLGKNFDAKIGDFGLSKFLDVIEDPNTLYSRKIPGTKVYKDPQYAKDGKLKIESDVYSFGVVLCEILCGRVAYHPVYTRINKNGLAAIAWQHFNRGTADEILDPKIKEETAKTVFPSVKGPNQDSLATFSQIAHQCLAETQTNRPMMEMVIKELEKAIMFQENRKDIFQISLKDIKLATKNFSRENLIGGGGFGRVYKGEVPHANGFTSIAVRRLDTRYAEHVSTELKILMEHKHENVIGLVGYCDEMDEKIIVYEYASNGSLDLYLKNVSLTWGKRLKICIDIAEGLDFLHGAVVTQDMVIHRNVKSSNILLNDDMKAKISDFGLSIIRPMNLERVFYTDNIAGTLSYIDPQYKSTGMLSKECDIYSFGIVLFEIMLRRLSFSREFAKEGYLGSLIKRQYKKGKLEEMVFEGTNEHITPQSLTIFQRIAIQCLHDKREERPTAGEVAIQLKKALQIQEKGMGIVRIPFEDIKFATDNFSVERLIGEGGFGNVYVGEVTHANKQIMIAAKRLERKRGQGDLEFNKELEIMFKFRHKNVIGLEGYCDEMEERIIVYEHASRGSLDKWLKNDDLSWMKRLEICIDVANGLNFLHGGVLRQEAVIHRDIKSANILLKDDWRAKITDFGLSLINPINQETEKEFVIALPAGTNGYVDPSYMETGLLTKQSDIYSFGVILLEILCGTLVLEKINGQKYILTSLFKQHYKKRTLDEIVFEAIREQIVPQSLTTFADIANKCLQPQGRNRPTTSEVVVQLKKALEFQEDHEKWEPKLPKDYKEIIEMSKSPNFYFTKKKKDLHDMFNRGILIQNGKVLFSLDHSRKRNEMISAMLFSYQNERSYKRRHMRISRFPKVSMMLDTSDLKIKIQIKPQLLSPDVIYGVYLVFKFSEPNKILSSKSMYVNLKYKKGNETRHAYFASWRDDKWMMIELYQFLNQNYNDDDNDVEVLLESFSRYYCGSRAIYVEGIEFRAMHNDKLEEINKLNDVQLFQRSKDPINREKFSLSEVKGRKQYMIFAKEVVYDSSSVKLLSSTSFDESRFPEMVELLSQQVFRIKCKIKSQMLSPDTNYMCYLVFKLSEKCRGLQCPVKVRDLVRRNNKETQIVYFRYPTQWNLHDFIHVPKLRGDGWMEVNVWKFTSDSEAKNECIPVNLKLICYEGTMSGLIVSGLEFRPV